MYARPTVCIGLALAFCSLAAAGTPTVATAQIPEPDSVVLREDYGQSQPDLAFSGDTCVAVWTTAGGSEWGLSTDRGRHWTRLQFPILPFDQVGIRARVCADREGNFYSSLLYDNSSAITCYRMHMDGGTMAISGPSFAASLLGGDPYDSPHIACDPGGAMVCVSYTYVVPSGPTATGSIEIVRSRDGGVTWSAPVQLGGSASNGSSIAVGPDGEVVVSWEDFATGTVQVATSRDSGATFSTPVAAGAILDDLGVPQPGWDDGSGRFAPGYVERYIDADFPSLAIDTSTGPNRGSAYLTWTDYRDGSLGSSTGAIDEGEPNDFFTQARLVQVGQDVSGVSYSYEFAGGDDCDYFYFDGVAGDMVEIHGVVNATSPAAPSSWSAGAQLLCGVDTTHLCQLAFKYMKQPGAGSIPIVIATLPRTGRYYLVTGCSDYYSYSYTLSLREWVPTGPGVSRDSRDVVLVRSTDGGQSWSPKVRVNDSPAGVDDCLPRVVVDGAGRVHVAWYDRRDDPGCGSVAKTYWTHSEDGAMSFAPSVALSSVGTNWLAFGGAITNIGDYLGLAADGNDVYVAWVDGRDPDPDLYRAIITDQATAAYAAQVSCRWTGAAVALDYRLPAGLPAGTISVQRSGPGGTVTILGDRSEAPGDYTVEDPSVAAGASYMYTVLLQQNAGGALTLGATSIEVPGTITRLELGLPEPNPSSGEMKIRLGLPRDAVGSVMLYDVAGHRVRSLMRGPLRSGAQDLTWDGRDDAGRTVPAGVYFVRLQAGHEQQSREVLRMY